MIFGALYRISRNFHFHYSEHQDYKIIKVAWFHRKSLTFDTSKFCTQRIVEGVTHIQRPIIEREIRSGYIVLKSTSKDYILIHRSTKVDFSNVMAQN